MKINEDAKNQFEEQLIKFKTAKSHAVITDLNYVIKQIHNLYCMVNGLSKEEFESIYVEELSKLDTKQNEVENVNDKICTEDNEKEDETKETKNDYDSEIFDKILNSANIDITEDPSLKGIEDKSVSDIMKEELNNWGLNEDYVGCKFILQLVECAENANIKPSDDYEDICKKVSDYYDNITDAAQFKRAITFIRKKADFSKSDYLSILRVLSDIDNYILLKNIIELCY